MSAQNNIQIQCLNRIHVFANHFVWYLLLRFQRLTAEHRFQNIVKEN